MKESITHTEKNLTCTIEEWFQEAFDNQAFAGTKILTQNQKKRIYEAIGILEKVVDECYQNCTGNQIVG